MRNYLSFGGGVNSTAMLLLLLDEGWDFEAIYSDHGCDLPETRRFVYWLSKHTPITILRPDVQGFDNLYDYCWHTKTIPMVMHRACTDKFKLRPIRKYCEPPAFELIGISTDEGHRAKIRNEGGLESRFPLMEYDLNREDCKRIIQEHGIPVPVKSGCFFCPLQPLKSWRELRRDHPELFCKAKQLEERSGEYRRSQGKRFTGLRGIEGKTLDNIVDEDQRELFKEFEYPPCRCEL